MTAPGGVRRWTWYEKLRYAEEGEWPKRGATILVPKAELDALAAKLAYYEKPFNDRGETEAQWIERNIYENRQKNEDLAAKLAALDEMDMCRGHDDRRVLCCHDCWKKLHATISETDTKLAEAEGRYETSHASRLHAEKALERAERERDEFFSQKEDFWQRCERQSALLEKADAEITRLTGELAAKEGEK